MKKQIDLLNQNIELTEEVAETLAVEYSNMEYAEVDQEVVDAFKAGLRKQLELATQDNTWMNVNREIIQKRFGKL
jgi:hypothetical protein